MSSKKESAQKLEQIGTITIYHNLIDGGINTIPISGVYGYEDNAIKAYDLDGNSIFITNLPAVVTWKRQIPY